MSADSSLSSYSSIHANTTVSTTNKGYQNDTLNPYFMHPNKNHALFLITPLLNAAFPATQSQGRGNNSIRGRGSRGGRSFYGRVKGMRVCTRCGMTNYIIDTCFKKHGYPPHWQQQGQVNNVSTDHDQEDEDQPETSEEQLNDSASGLIGFTPA
ncbi:hypothetical protein KIW84_073767 [Lathyrus oleraceus]|uniref:Uncharacterized protein n=1 Tax=Pisum sativum TaxID=3888 RepID=A0A9D4ZX43_PEA|nr:hypothetical protein KIW84_073767 [Pisum sativum]